MTTPTDPTTTGMAISHDPKDPQHRDVFDYALAEYLKSREADPAFRADGGAWPAAYAGIKDYVDFARQLFSKNQAVSQDFLGASLNLRFQNNLVLPFCDTGTVPEMGTNTGAMPLTTPDKPDPSNAGAGKTLPTMSWGITGDS